MGADNGSPGRFTGYMAVFRISSNLVNIEFTIVWITMSFVLIEAVNLN
uniref:Uncharacterized protein n=1 Tax=Tetranychus urticae TaxID=32264 RepID=T1JS15_TETUR